LFIGSDEEFKIPTLDIPTLNIPDLTITKLNIPSIEIPETGIQSVESNNTDILNLAAVTNINTDYSNTSQPTINTSLNFVEPVKNLETVETISIEQPNVNIEIATLDNDIIINKKELNLDLTNITDLSYWEKRQKIIQEFKKLVKDVRNSDYSQHPYFNEWLTIYKDYKTISTPIKYIPIPAGFKIISEVYKPTTLKEYNKLKSNLAFYKSKGYNGVLINVCTGDTPIDMVNIARLIKTYKMYPFFCFGGTEKLEDEIFVNPQWIKDIITSLAPECYGFLPWRRTALHLFLPDEAYNNFIHTQLRIANPNIYILGEIYYGKTAIDHDQIKWWVNIPKNCSGIILSSLGYNYINAEKLYKQVRKLSGNQNLPIMARILGDKPYYNTLNKTKLNFRENLQIKKELENRFIKAGFNGTFTCSNDGSNGIYNKYITENLCK
jgi:Txe/YoeB family toxin of Txe-Axe toxin-antitoxin module